jgi:hypothetical protein
MNSKTAPLLASPQWGEVGGGPVFLLFDFQWPYFCGLKITKKLC